MLRPVGEIEADESPATHAGPPPPEPAGARRLPALVATLVTAVVVIAPIGALIASGGLADVPSSGPEEIGVQERVIGAEQSFSVQRVAVVDTLQGSGSFPDEDAGERVLAVLIDVTNLDDVPRSTGGDGAVGAIRVEGLPDERPAIAVYGDDDYSAVTLQPDVPARLLLTWVVPADEISDDDEVRVVLPDAEKFESLLFGGEVSWSALGPSAIVTARVDDLGDGGEDGRL